MFDDFVYVDDGVGFEIEGVVDFFECGVVV